MDTQWTGETILCDSDTFEKIKLCCLLIELIKHGNAQAMHTHSNNCAVPLDVSTCDI